MQSVRSSPSRSVVVEKIAKRHVAIAVFDLGQHSARAHLRLDQSGRERHLGEFAQDQRLEPRRRQ
jgi:hypothetical protein